MSELSRSDLRAALDVVGALAGNSGTDPFSVDVLTRLQEVTGADSCVGYVEGGFDKASRNYEVVTRPQPPWLSSALDEMGQQDPIHAVHCQATTIPVAISDKMTVREFQRLPIYRLVCEPLGTADSLRIYLPAPPGSARFFFFDRSRRGFPARTRNILQLLRPHLVNARAQHPDDLQSPRRVSLTARQTTIMQWVARGASNTEIASRLWVSEHTVRKHLENVYAKLDVHSRTAAVATLRDSTYRDPAQ